MASEALLQIFKYNSIRMSDTKNISIIDDDLINKLAYTVKKCIGNDNYNYMTNDQFNIYLLIKESYIHKNIVKTNKFIVGIKVHDKYVIIIRFKTQHEYDLFLSKLNDMLNKNIVIEDSWKKPPSNLSQFINSKCQEPNLWQLYPI